MINSDSTGAGASAGGSAATTGAAGGFKKGGFKSSFSSVKTPPAPVKKNVLGDEDEDEDMIEDRDVDRDVKPVEKAPLQDESDTDEEYPTGSYYDPRRPTECSATCSSL